MGALTLIIGNRNYSSWSLRPWMLLRHLSLEFTTELVPLDQPESARRLQELSPSGRVPALRHGELLLWDSIAIGEYLCELTGRGLPRERNARALARCISAEMHAGFQALRTQWPMNARASGRHTPMTAALLRDIARIDALWRECRTQPGAPRPWLFGEYSLADAMYAPVALRFRTYGAQLSPVAAQYVDAVLADPLMQEWLAAAAAEPWTIGADEAGA